MKKDIAAKEVIRVSVDDRERSDELLKALGDLPGFRTETARLPVGDYQVDNLIVERKTFPDLVAS